MKPYFALLFITSLLLVGCTVKEKSAGKSPFYQELVELYENRTSETLRLAVTEEFYQGIWDNEPSPYDLFGKTIKKTVRQYNNSRPRSPHIIRSVSSEDDWYSSLLTVEEEGEENIMRGWINRSYYCDGGREISYSTSTPYFVTEREVTDCSSEMLPVRFKHLFPPPTARYEKRNGTHVFLDEKDSLLGRQKITWIFSADKKPISITSESIVPENKTQPARFRNKRVTTVNEFELDVPLPDSLFDIPSTLASLPRCFISKEEQKAASTQWRIAMGKAKNKTITEGEQKTAFESLPWRRCMQKYKPDNSSL